MSIDPRPFFDAIAGALISRATPALRCEAELRSVFADFLDAVWERLASSWRAQSISSQLRLLVELPKEALSASAYEAGRDAICSSSVSETFEPEGPDRTARRIAVYIERTVATIRKAFADSGPNAADTMLAGLRVHAPDDLSELLPHRLPRFLPGDKPTFLSTWELVELLGMGGFGEVWKARHHRLHSTLAAIKFCLNRYAADYLKHEARVLDRVLIQSHQGNISGVVKLLDANWDCQIPWLRFEYIDGGDLAGVIRAWRMSGANNYPRFHVTALVQQLAGIVGTFHRLDPPITHRDLKPANILVQGDPLDPINLRLRVADFGIGLVGSTASARADLALSSTTTAHNLTLLSRLRGAHTALYASPQQKRGAPPDIRDDVYSIGVIWYQLLVGDPSREVHVNIDSELQSLKVSPGEIGLLKSCLSTDPENRPASASELAEQIGTLSYSVRRLREIVGAVREKQLASGGGGLPNLDAVPGKLSGTFNIFRSKRYGDRDTNSIGMTFVWVPPGKFQMGAPEDEPGWHEDETLHPVDLTRGFYMAIHLVTHAAWREIMGNNPSQFRGQKNLPVDSITWLEAQEFCRRLSERERRRYRLPTEAEWEYCCRAGTQTAYNVGHTLTTAQANYDPRVKGNWQPDFRGGPVPVGGFPPNAFGLYDMHGNLFEWCEDTYGPYPNAVEINPCRRDNTTYRVYRGGSWNSPMIHCRAAYRGYGNLQQNLPSIGFRVVLIDE